MCVRLTSAVLSLLLMAYGNASAADPAVWQQWRGPTRDGQVTGTAWPDTLKGDAIKPLWKVENLGPSYSGPIVASDRVFTTETVDKKTEVVTAYDRKSGKELWKTKWEGSISVPFFAAKNGSWIRSTPAYDGKTLFVAGIKDLLVALEGESGKELWRFDFVKEFAASPPAFGFVCSPLVDDSGVYVQAGGCFAKLDKATGKVLWKTMNDGGGMNGSAFSSPVFARLAGKDQVVVQSRTKLGGVERDTGKELWVKEIPSFRGMNILTPTPIGDGGVLTSTYGGNTRLLKVTSEGGKYETSDDWSLKYEGNMTSPVIVKGHAYILGKDRRLICVDVATGKEKWRTDERFGEYWSVVANGDKILALDNRGVLFLLKANPVEYELLDQRKIADSECWAHLAVCGDEIYIRELTGLRVFRWSK
ncbi:MAG: pyrrolo-quinoline quinone [Planctomycetaceae bacterium]|nr:pyrrolo-quinoline quinone [Planctomycetaceae bacterium]